MDDHDIHKEEGSLSPLINVTVVGSSPTGRIPARRSPLPGDLFSLALRFYNPDCKQASEEEFGVCCHKAGGRKQQRVAR